MGELFEARVGFNESAFRAVNEKMRGTGGDPIAFRCECARLGCTELLKLTPQQYEAVRAHPRRYFVTPGHALPDVEAVVERHGHYDVIEKRGAGGDVAERTDPRRDA